MIGATELGSNLHVDGVDDNTVIEVTDEDLQQVLAATEKFYAEQLPAVLEDTASRTADDLLKDLKKRWREEGPAQKADVDGFEDRLEDRWGNIDGLPTLLAGASNAGLTDPAQHTAVSFVQLIMLIIGDSSRFDDLVTAQLLLRFQNLIPHEFWKAEKKLRRDDRRHRRSKKRA